MSARARRDEMNQEREGRTSATSNDHGRVADGLPQQDLFESSSKSTSHPNGLELGKVKQVSSCDGGEDTCSKRKDASK